MVIYVVFSLNGSGARGECMKGKGSGVGTVGMVEKQIKRGKVRDENTRGDVGGNKKWDVAFSQPSASHTVTCPTALVDGIFDLDRL